MVVVPTTRPRVSVTASLCAWEKTKRGSIGRERERGREIESEGGGGRKIERGREGEREKINFI